MGRMYGKECGKLFGGNFGGFAATLAFEMILRWAQFYNMCKVGVALCSARSESEVRVVRRESEGGWRCSLVQVPIVPMLPPMLFIKQDATIDEWRWRGGTTVTLRDRPARRESAEA